MNGSSALEIDNLAVLARLRLSIHEHDGLTQDLRNIITYVETLNAVDTEQVEATSHVLNLENVFRQDVVRNVGSADAILNDLPDTRKEDGCFKVPKVIEDN